MKRLISILTAALVLASLLVVCFSCKKNPSIIDKDPDKNPRILVDGDITSIDFDAGNTQKEKISFFSNRDWTVSCPEDWLHIQPLSGTASDYNEITLSCDSNEGDEDRSAEVTITVDGLTKVISVKQLRSLTFYLSVDQISLHEPYEPFVLVNADARTIEVPVITNFEYSVNIRAPWISPAGTKGTTTEKQTFSVADNPSPAGRSGIIEFSVNYANQVTVTRKITVYQLGGASETPEAVDLGLSVKWASFNVGATRAEEPGLLFAWGETASKDEYTEENYKWNGPDGLTKYCYLEEFGTVDNKMELDLEDDAAYVAYGEGWHIPTMEQIFELVDNTHWNYASIDGREGMIFIAENEGYENNYLFIPLVWDPDDAIERSSYWSSSLYSQFVPSQAFTLTMGRGSLNLYWMNDRWLGRLVRAVKDK